MANPFMISEFLPHFLTSLSYYVFQSEDLIILSGGEPVQEGPAVCIELDSLGISCAFEGSAL